MINKADSYQIKVILDNSYTIPKYQREYSWNKDNWEDLYSDILESEENYFLGSIICIGSAGNFELVDGQQRLTTLSLFLLAIYESINRYHKNNPQEKILDYSSNKEKVTLVGQLSECLVNGEIPRLILSTQNRNNDDYRFLLQRNDLLCDIEKPANFGNRRISKAYNFFLHKLHDENEDLNISIDDLFRLLKKVFSAMLVRIDVNNASDAFVLFESINHRGMELSPIDLLKNSMLAHYEKKDVDTAYEKWQLVLKNIEEYTDQVRFLRHFYNVFQFHYKLKTPGSSKATKANLIRIYTELITKDAKGLLDQLVLNSKIYKKIILPEDLSNDDPYYGLRKQLHDLKRLSCIPANMLLLHVFNKVTQPKEIIHFKELLEFIETWFIRRHLVDYPATRDLDQIFIDLIEKINTEVSVTTIIKLTKEFLTGKHPDTGKKMYKNDEEIRKALTDDLYTINKNLVRYILIRLEEKQRTKEEKIDFWELENNKPIWTIEHILPQDSKHWNDPCWENIDKTIYLHVLGNLTLSGYNSSLSNKPFEDKRDATNNDDKPIGYQNDIKLNEYIKDQNTWCSDHITERTQLLSNMFLEAFSLEE